MNEALSNYEIAIKDLVYRPGVSIVELITPATAKKINQFFSTISKEVRKEFNNPRLISIFRIPCIISGRKTFKHPRLLQLYELC